MAERINLAQFDIDTRLLEDKIAQNQLKIDLLRGEINETKKTIKDYQNQIKLLAGVVSQNTEKQEKANEELQQGIITQEQYNSIIEQTSQVIRESENQLASLIETEREQQQQVVRYQRDLRAVNEENRELNNLLRAGRTEVTGNEGAYRELSNELSAVRQEANNLGAQLRELEQNGQRNSQEYLRLNRQWQETANRARDLHEELLDLDRATGDNRRNVGNYADSIREAFGGIGTGFAQLMSGNITGGLESIKKGFKDVAGSAKDLWTAILTNPMAALQVALVAVAVGLYNGMKAVVEYNLEISKLNKKIESLTNLTGSVVDDLREYATSLEKVFGREFDESIREMNSLMKDFGLTSKEAFDLYNEGLAKGGATNSEFGDSIREYGVLFAQNGYSAEDFLNLLNAGIDLDIYSDKLPDAIKEAGLALNEQTKATRDALINAFGESFSDDLLKRVRNGSITVKQAVDEIAAQAQKVGLNTQQIAQLNADVFKGAGEDAGGLVKVIEAVNLANNKNAQTLTKSQESTIKLVEANVALEDAKTKALKSDAIQSFTSAIDLLWLKTKTAYYELIASFRGTIDWLDETTKSSILLNKTLDALNKLGSEVLKTFKALTDVFKDLFDAIATSDENTNHWIKSLAILLNPINFVKGAINLLSASIRSFTVLIDGSRVLLTGFAITAKNLFTEVLSIANSVIGLDFSGALEKIKNFSITGELVKARKEAEKIVALNKEAKKQNQEDAKKPENTIKGNDKLTGAAADAAAKAAKEREKMLEKQQKEADAARKKAEKEAEAAAKQDLANAKERADVAIQAINAELGQYIAMNAEKLKSDKRLTQARVNELKEYFDKVKQETLKANELERQQKLQSLDDQLAAIKGASAQELGQKKNLEAQKEVIRKEYDTKEIQIVNDSYDKQRDLDQKFLQQKNEDDRLYRSIAFQQKILDLEEQGATEREIKLAQEQQRFQEELQTWAEQNQIKFDLDNDKFISDQEIQAERDELQLEYNTAKDEAEKLRIQSQLDAIDNITRTSANNRIAIERAVDQAKIQGKIAVLKGVAQIFGQETVIGKAAALTQLALSKAEAVGTILTAMGVANAKAVAASPLTGGLPFTAVNTVQLLAAIASVGSGVAQAIGIISGAKMDGVSQGLDGLSQGLSQIGNKKAAKGMIAKGPSHANGGINAITPEGMVEIEGGEAVINKKSTAMFYDVLSEINQLGGGVKFANGGIQGGLNVSRLPTVQNTFKNAIDMNMLGEVLKDYIVEGSLIGTQLGSKEGIVGLSENREIQRGANF